MQPDIDDHAPAQAASAILRRHERYEAEANITSAVRDFLIATGLAQAEQIVEENPPSDASRRAVDLTALDTFVEMKRRICGTNRGFDPNPEYVQQLDDYLAASERDGKGVRTGVLTDGKYWLLRWHGAGAVKTTPPYGFTLESGDKWLPLYEWLRDKALTSLERIHPDPEAVAHHLGPQSPSYERDIARLKALYEEGAHYETLKVKRRLWYDLLRTALGEIAHDTAQMDDLFVRHTYLTAVIGMVVQASFGIDIQHLAETDAADLLHGRKFRNDTGLQGVVESDFFAWPTEVGGLPLIATMARRIARFDWQAGDTPNDIAAILYETVIPPEERRTLGEYYTPQWLAKIMTRELVTDPLNQRVLDPSCGSGTFIAEAVNHFIDAARSADVAPAEVFSMLRRRVTGIDVHPVAVHLARAAYALAARPAIEDADYTSISVPIYLGDALQLRYRSGDMFATHEITIQVGDEENTELVFPVSLIEHADTFDALMGDIATYIETGDDPTLALADHHITDAGERQTLSTTIATMQRLHDEGRNHIWAYYTRNMVRPVALERAKVDVIIGNPPWLNYRNTADTLRTELEQQSKSLYGIWAGGRYATHQDVAGLFFARTVHLYLKTDGVIGMVMPHSALQTGQYSKWRTGNWRSTSGTRTVSVDFGFKRAWDLERLKPNTFFPVPSSVVFAKNLKPDVDGSPLAGRVERWQGAAGAADVRRVPARITDTSADGGSPYAAHSEQGAVIVPRCLFFVNETENTAIIRAGQTITVNPRRGSQDKPPWKTLDLAAISEQTIEKAHVFDVHLGETVVPYATLDPLKVILPLKQGDAQIPIAEADENGVGGISLAGLERRMRGRWRTVSSLWEDNKRRVSKISLLEQLNYYGHISSQLRWQQDAEGRPVRIVYTKSGAPTAALIDDDDTIIDHLLFWVACKDVQEANYLLGVINSDALYESSKPLMSKGQFGARDLHKHLWKLPIPEFDAENRLHADLSAAGKAAETAACEELERLRAERAAQNKVFSVTVARRELRKWLRSSVEGRRVEALVGELLGRG